MGRVTRRQETDFCKAQRLLQLERGAQMPVMNRVERAAKNADRSHGKLQS
jgi:hypothetical protein